MLNRRRFMASHSMFPISMGSLLSGFGVSTKQPKENPPTEFQGGEYLGSFTDGKNFGLQIAPTTGQNFAFHVYSGGLPGLGYDGLWQEQLKGRLSDNSLNFLADGGGWMIEGDLKNLKGFNQKGESLKATKIPARTPKTVGLKPSGLVKILFDGGSLDSWKRGKKDKDGNLQVGCETVDGFRDFLLHIEFRLPFLPNQKGQDRANSGVYIQNRYEIQILDSFALAGTKNECGSIYEFRAPEVNACLPPGEWQSYDIDFRSARFEDRKKIKNALISVRHNGVLVHNQIEVPNQTGYGRKEGPESGPIHLQNHGAPVVFRNIWIIEK